VQKIYPEIQQFGGEVLAVSFTPPARVKAYLEQYPLPFPVVSDSSLAAYKRFSLERTSVGSLFRPGVILRYLLAMARGWLPTKPGKGEDILQLGGDFILDGSRRLVYAHPSAEPTDRPAVQDLLAVMKKQTKASA